MRNIGIIAGIFDHTAASLVCCIRARVQLKRDLLPSGQANAGMRKATLVDEGTQATLGGSGRTGPVV